MRYSLSVLFVCCFFGTFAQVSSDSTKNAEPWTYQKANKVYKFSPLDVFSVIPTFGMDLELELKKSFAVQGGVGIIPSFMQYLANENFNDFDRMGGYKLRAEGRMYMPVRTNRYLAFGVSFRHLIIRDEVPIGMEGTENEWGQQDFAYFINTPMLFNRFNTNYELKLGFQRVFGGNIAFDFYTGLSIRTINVQSSSEIPEGGSIPEQRGMWRLEDNYKFTYPTPIIGFKFGFVK